ncbi:HIT family protein [Candidatus Microgenomates bacterium]|nr:HIT family protein [Candidatus Microgenomates bacterium]
MAQTNSAGTLIRGTDIIYRDDLVTCLINSFFVGKNAGHVIVVPNRHYENLYDLPVKYGHRIFDISQRIAILMKQLYRCDGITLKQNNEPAGDQHAFHYHLHIFPRYHDDNFNLQQPTNKRLANSDERSQYAAKFRAALARK